MTLVYRFITEDELPTDELSAKQLIRRSSRYVLINGWLYRRSSTQSWIRCITKDDSRSIVKDIYERDCGSHEGA